MLKVSQIKLPYQYETKDLHQAIAKKMHLPETELIDIKLLKRSLDARQSKRSGHAGEIVYQMTVAVSIKNEKAYLKKRHSADIQVYEPHPYVFPYQAVQAPPKPPIIIGSGPAGLFCGLMLARNGYQPIIIERGKDVQSRMAAVDTFWQTGKLDPNCNVQFGEGGAGTFSDGKLNTLVKDATGRHQKVLEIFVEAGAPEDILYAQKPHIGTDLLVDVVAHIRNEIIALGGQVLFESKATDFMIDAHQVLNAVEVNHKMIMSTNHVVIAIGHSARDTFQVMFEHQLQMEQKPFAIGVRIEHPQAMINAAQYGAEADYLSAADYKLTCKTSNGRNVYTFCMCPGGYVVNASSEPDRLVVNGMSYRNRKGENANSAVIVNVIPDDFGSEHPLAGVTFQRHWESAAYKEGNGNVPVQLFGDFKANQTSSAFGDVLPAHKGTYQLANLRNCLPEYVADSLSEAIDQFGTKIKGYDRSDAIMSGIETRTSSPVRMTRDQNCESNIKGIFPCGEGAGYAGGITSAAIDGIRVAEAVAASLNHTLS